MMGMVLVFLLAKTVFVYIWVVGSHIKKWHFRKKFDFLEIQVMREKYDLNSFTTHFLGPETQILSVLQILYKIVGDNI
ncbi:hypothetical protein EYC80_005298 [Monilinia laxa]|uniref:Uncharacterized protein n=1 Tax=Monilinia laxa TaxID=61186 RepID=A0A5N6KJG7_MONLA|nr:hypothetical protein EYC80_005298 [Monilinia laxa]